ncbi:dihydroneopterin aldolase [Gracilimonas sp.]|uniref:dihydroneopterin aldolase n=1 Tax=Gracilimonas sp. TaxID=1974203 RepID=UPI0028714EC4|nr:dihydroneopterin aldolase [Gracilimonas sp.]
MDTLTIKGMQFRGHHGVHDHEKKEGNDFEVDVIFNTYLSKSAKSDELSDTVDYSKVHQIASEIMNGKSVNLIEHLCFKIGTEIAQTFPYHTKFEVIVRKLNPPLSKPVEFSEIRMSWPR